MATLRLVVQKKRKDGYWPVYIRVVHRGKPSFMPTGKVVNDKGLTKSREIKDTFVLSLLMPRIVEYTEALNRVDVTNWSVQEVVNFLKTGTEDISFSEYARRHADRMVDEGHVRNARNYVLALQHLERFLGTTDVKFSALTSATIEKWIRSLSTTSRAKEMYPVCLRQVFRAALLDYNDYDKGVMRIKTNPWMRIRIPRADRPEKLAITPEEARAFFAAPLPQTKVVAPLSEVGRDTAMFVLCLAGINTVDLYNMRKRDYHEGILHYKRSKTRGSRSDEAYIEMRVPPILQPLMEKYATGDDDDRLFSFHNRFSTSDSFGSGANTGIKQICESMGITGDSRYCVYTFRHTWGTVAQNDCGATIAEVAFAMNHSDGHNVTRGYIRPDFSPAWELNEKVVEFIFFTNNPSSRHREDEGPGIFRFSPKQMIHAGIYFKGELLGEIRDIGYGNVDEVIGKLLAFVPEQIPNRSNVQIKIEIVDKGQVAHFERMKGVSF